MAVNYVNNSGEETLFGPYLLMTTLKQEWFGDLLKATQWVTEPRQKPSSVWVKVKIVPLHDTEPAQRVHFRENLPFVPNF